MDIGGGLWRKCLKVFMDARSRIMKSIKGMSIMIERLQFPSV
ncbi:hypothetical protein AA18889_2628 [Acetobacter senegalensis DSM 18889]|nr:hypothetical protein AA18889_2628 [Acetobacter senegalensis DSM 18889]